MKVWSKRARPKKERKRKEAPQSFGAQIENKKSSILKDLKKHIQELKAEMAEKRKILSTLKSRKNVLKRRQLLMEVNEIKSKLANLKEKKPLNDFTRVITPLVTEYEALRKQEEAHHKSTVVSGGNNVQTLVKKENVSLPKPTKRQKLTRRPIDNITSAKRWYDLPLSCPSIVTTEEGVQRIELKTEVEQMRQRKHKLGKIQKAVNSIQESFQFHSSTGELMPRFIEQDQCPECRTTLRELRDESMLVCPNCSASVKRIDATSAGLPYGEEFEITKHVYKRRKHFEALMYQFRKGTKPIPDQVIIDLKQVYAALHIHSEYEIRPTTIKIILKKLGYPQFVDFASRILRRMVNIPIAGFTDEEIRDYVKLFDDMQTPFLMHKAAPRTNFLNASFVINRLSDIQNKPWFKECFPLMKSRNVMKEQEAMWKQMCDAIGWTYKESH